ncbi:hypothetical protein GF327_09855 [Candidatus Woesearchaeota archaeon]|nr:hypothetical protein [Candidatus Woesearchaeota archaeon]
MALDIILFAGLIIMIGYVANIFSEKTKIPESLFMIMIGVLIGPVLQLTNPADLRSIAGTFATISIIIILIDSGLDFDIRLLFRKMLDASLFTILVNVLITLFVGLFVHFVYGWNILHGFLLGIVSSGTTTVMIQSLIEGLDINRETKYLLVLESILNDTTLIMIAVSLIGLIKTHGTNTLFDSIMNSFQDFLGQFFIGIFFGMIFFIAWLHTVKAIPGKKKKDYVFLISILFIQYGVVDFLGGSGIVSVLFFSLFLGNQKRIMKAFNLEEKFHTRGHLKSLRSIKLIQQDFSFFIKSFFFVFLGMIIDLNSITLQVVLMSFVIILIMILTRFLAVKIIALIEKKYIKDAFLISTMVPRGFVATLLAFLPYNEGIEIPLFPEVVTLLIFSTSIVSIFGAIIFRKKTEKKKDDKDKKEN